jgi:hypothetical protein
MLNCPPIKLPKSLLKDILFGSTFEKDNSLKIWKKKIIYFQISGNECTFKNARFYDVKGKIIILSNA